MWTTDVPGAVSDDYYYSSSEPPDWVFCTHEQALSIERELGPWSNGHWLKLVIRQDRGRHSRPELLSDPDWKGRITP